MQDYDKLTNMIREWALARNLLGPNGEATARGQAEKTREELNELDYAIADASHGEVKDAIGDIYVTLVIQAELWGLDMRDCIEHAWEQIKDRTGRMENGQFVKDPPPAVIGDEDDGTPD